MNDFRSKQFDDNNIENDDEAHFNIKMDNWKAIVFSGETKARYAEMVSGKEGIENLVRISGGKEVKVKFFFMLFKNGKHGYRIRYIPDEITNLPYRNGPK